MCVVIIFMRKLICCANIRYCEKKNSLLSLILLFFAVLLTHEMLATWIFHRRFLVGCWNTRCPTTEAPAGPNHERVFLKSQAGHDLSLLSRLCQPSQRIPSEENLQPSEPDDGSDSNFCVEGALLSFFMVCIVPRDCLKGFFFVLLFPTCLYLNSVFAKMLPK